MSFDNLLNGPAPTYLPLHAQLAQLNPQRLDFVSRSDWKTVTPAFMIDPVADAGRFELWPLRDPEVMFSIVVVEKTNSVLPAEAQELVALVHEEADRAARHWT